MSRERSRKAKRLSPLLVQLVHATEQYVGEHGDDDGRRTEIQSAGEVLQELGVLAQWALPVHGVFVPNNEEVSRLIERAASRHLGLDAAQRELRRALESLESLAVRDSVESAQNHVRAVSEEAYFYAGFAFGLTATAPPQR
jgi:hypothetical protein